MLAEYLDFFVRNPLLIFMLVIKVAFGIAVVMTALYCWTLIPTFLKRMSNRTKSKISR